MPSSYERPTPKTFAGPPVGGTATTSPSRADGPVTGRNAVTIWNEDPTVTLRVGTSASVSPTQGNALCGVPILPGEFLTFSWSDKLSVYVVAASSIKYTVLEEG